MSFDTRGVCGETTTGEFVEILKFRHFERFMRFDKDDRNHVKKAISDGVNVSVVLHIESPNT